MENRSKGNVNLRYNILTIIVFIVGIVLLIQLINLQIVNGDEYRKQSSTRLTRETTMHADRGEILDRNGVKLVTTSTGYSLNLRMTYEKTKQDRYNNKPDTIIFRSCLCHILYSKRYSRKNGAFVQRYGI